MKRDRDIRGKLAVVTGASSGIGLCFSRELGARGCNVVMVSNQREELERFSSELSAEFGVSTYPVYADLTCEDAPDLIVGYLDEHGLREDYLINNAGIFSFLPVTDTPECKIDCFIRLHVDAVTMLSRRFAMRFKKRGVGRILNMSSMSCWMPMPGIAMYAATKAYIRVFSRALHYELRDYGVSVTVACPGGIATDLFGLPEPLKRLAVRIGALDTPERFAKKALNRMLKGKRQYINGIINRISIVFVASLPTWVRMQIKRRMLDKGVTR